MRALAQEPTPTPTPTPTAVPCPTSPAAIEDPEADAVVVELRELRRDLAASCDATTDAASRLPDDAPRRSQLSQLLDSLDAPRDVHLVGVDAEHPLPVEEQAEASPGAVTEVELVNDQPFLDGLADVRTDLWFGIGLLAALPLFYGLWRVVMPRA